MAPTTTIEPLLRVTGLETSIRFGRNWVPAIKDVTFSVNRGETVVIVGESGCGKSLTALSLMRLLPRGKGKITDGHAHFDGIDLANASEPIMRRLRGDRLAMIFQEPMTALNPVLQVGFQVAEALRHHKGLSAREASARALEILEHVRIPSARQRFADYPHQFSGGMRQRVMIAMAIACKPAILLADEPTTALDVTIQAQVLALMDELKVELGMGLILITHNMGVVASMADQVAVMYAGEIVELAPVDALFENPIHPYTEALLAAIPRHDRTSIDLRAIEGQVPALRAMPSGCRFAPRCPLRQPACSQDSPVLRPVDGTRLARCHVRAPDRQEATA